MQSDAIGIYPWMKEVSCWSLSIHHLDGSAIRSLLLASNLPSLPKAYETTLQRFRRSWNWRRWHHNCMQKQKSSMISVYTQSWNAVKRSTYVDFFKWKEVTYIGQKPTQDGIKADDNKVRAIIVNRGEWLWNPSNVFVVGFCFLFWPWPCTKHNSCLLRTE